MIIEGLLTTENIDGTPHVAPMGPVVNEPLTQWTMRPFQSSTTFRLLRSNPQCVFHVVDDVLPVVQAALGQPPELDFHRGPSGGWVITSACHWYRLCVRDWDLSRPRSEARAELLEQEVLRPFWGWNRAKHAVLEATILATRLHLADRALIREDFAKLATAVEKTAGPREWQAWNLLQNHLAAHS
ncbi:MAG: DUF447 family protein [Planctomycetales bacterium]|nr:DUF447 family protein [Planctomycetales bacterium]